MVGGGTQAACRQPHENLGRASGQSMRGDDDGGDDVGDDDDGGVGVVTVAQSRRWSDSC